MATVSLHKLAEVLKIDPRHVQRLVSQGVLQRPKTRGEYDLGRNMAAFIAYKQERETLDGDPEKERVEDDELRKTRLRHLTAQADMAELELDRERGLVIPLTVYETENTARIIATKQRILQIPARWAAQLEFLDRYAIREKLIVAAHELLETLHGNHDSPITGNGNGSKPGQSPPEPPVAPAPEDAAEPVGAEKHRSESETKRKTRPAKARKISDRTP